MFSKGPSTDTSFKYTDLTNQIIKAFYTVYNLLGYGFFEKVYANALTVELHQLGLEIIREMPISVSYKNQVVGDYYADLVVSDSVIIEIKAAQTLLNEHEAQLLNYLRATKYEVGLLLNFGPKPQIKRKAFDNDRKNQAT